MNNGWFVSGSETSFVVYTATKTSFEYKEKV